MILNLIYNKIAVALTKWENHRTKTEYDDALILKIFAFEFVNSYSSLFYLAYFRNINYEDGLFNLGAEYQDKCDNDNCMPLLTIQVLSILLIKPLPRFCFSILIPLLKEWFHSRKFKKDAKIIEENYAKNQQNINNQFIVNEKAVLLYADIERGKTKFEDTISGEYNEKVILFGYLVMFSASFSLAPLIVLIINLIDIRLDAQRLLWLYRRPIGYKAQDIGTWFNMCRLINIFGIINNGFMVAFTSDWSNNFLNDSNYKRAIFVLIFEHVAFACWFLIILLFSEAPNFIQEKIRKEKVYVKKLLTAAKLLKKEVIGTTSENSQINLNLNSQMEKKSNYNEIDPVIESFKNDKSHLFEKNLSRQTRTSLNRVQPI
ncbi:unnamed protein product [Brachionus calyciflorus]|uniref:Anoctamin n=1 Tax=Brachionus calyciflorus TaxID=104777 RepID=A0A813MMP7_9BILA|nr:unnamed protein product [Brachionus calyciflorus]